MSDWRDFKSVRVAEHEWMAFTDRAAQFIHRQVVELGYVHDPAAQSHYFARPSGAEGQMGGLVMRWQEVDAADPVAAAEAPVPDISGLSLAQKSDLAAQLKRDGVGGFGAPGPAPATDAAVGRALMPGQRFAHGGKVREVVAPDGEWVHVVDPETGRKSRMKGSTLDGWDAL